MNGRGRKALVAATMALGVGIVAQPAQALSTYVDGTTLKVVAAPGELNVLTVVGDPLEHGRLVVSDAGAIITPGTGCTTGAPLGKVAVCTIPVAPGWNPSLSMVLGDKSDTAVVRAALDRHEIDSGAGNDRLDVNGPYDGSARIVLGGGNDTLNVDGSISPRVEVFGGDGNDSIDASAQDGGVYYGDAGNDTITVSGWVSGGEGDDTLDGTHGMGNGTYLGGAGDDTITTADSDFDTIDCGLGIDALAPDEWDVFSGCETVG